MESPSQKFHIILEIGIKYRIVGSLNFPSKHFSSPLQKTSILININIFIYEKKKKKWNPISLLKSENSSTDVTDSLIVFLKFGTLKDTHRAWKINHNLSQF